MADKVKYSDVSNKKVNEIKDEFKKLDNAASASYLATYGIRKDIPGILSADTFEFGRTELSRRDDARAQVNSHISAYNISDKKTERDSRRENYDNLYEIMKDEDLIRSLESIVGTHNPKFKEMLQDYEIVKRCIPQVHKVLMSLKNNIISPDSITKKSIGIQFPQTIINNQKLPINSIIEDYNLNELLDKIVMEYLVVSVKYLSVVPYSHIINMVSSGSSINECVTAMEELTSDKIGTLLESSGTDVNNISVLQESADIFETNDYKIDGITQTFKPTERELQQADALIGTILENIEFVNGGMAYFKNAILNEAISTVNDNEDKAMAAIYDAFKKSTKKASASEAVPDGMLDSAELDKIKKKVKFKGCHIEHLDATRVIPFKMRETVIGYFYVEDRVGLQHADIRNAGIMDKINATIYQRAAGVNKQNEIENMVIKTVGDKIMRSINVKFLTDNMDDIDVIYEFVRENEIHRKAKRVVFFHPNDIVEFKRSEGSVMKNCMFMAKLMILTTLSNTIANVTRGADRNFYYVQTGLSTDINGHVNKAIRAIKQNQIRYSDIGSINDVFNIIGSNVDVFMPVSPDGQKPIETEVVSGQTIDMNSEFIQYLTKSIILSFGVPSVVVDQMDQVELAKTLSMSNLDIARTVLDAQVELIDPLTKLIRLITRYEVPECELIDEIYATLNAPTAIILEMTKEMVDSISEMGNTLAELLLPPEGESLSDKKKRLFKLAYFKMNVPSIDWDMITKLLDTIDVDIVEETKKDELKQLKANKDDGSGM